MIQAPRAPADYGTVEPEKDAWLFLRGEFAIRVTRMPGCSTLLVCGPGRAEHSHHFDSDASLDEFWRWYKRHLLAEEWVQQPTADRRAGREAASPGDRRRKSRSAAVA